jgi:hypothetical protein
MDYPRQTDLFHNNTTSILSGEFHLGAKGHNARQLYARIQSSIRPNRPSRFRIRKPLSDVVTFAISGACASLHFRGDDLNKALLLGALYTPV